MPPAPSAWLRRRRRLGREVTERYGSSSRQQPAALLRASKPDPGKSEPRMPRRGGCRPIDEALKARDSPRQGVYPKAGARANEPAAKRPRCSKILVYPHDSHRNHAPGSQPRSGSRSKRAANGERFRDARGKAQGRERPPRAGSQIGRAHV